MAFTHNQLIGSLCKQKSTPTWSQPQSENESQQSVNDFGCCILCHPTGVAPLLSIIEVLAAFIGNTVNVHEDSPDNEHQLSVNRASTEHQQSVTRALTILGVASCTIHRLYYSIHP
jgi:hypothetical protein